jgi:hypothetical protein
MQRFLLTILVAISLVGFVKAQEITGDKAEEVKKEIVKLEHEKDQALLSSRPACADWFDRHDADGLAYTGPAGDVWTKAQLIAGWRSGKREWHEIDHHTHNVHVYGSGGNGNTAVVTYVSAAKTENRITTDVWVKQDGVWQRVVHQVTPVLTK